MEHQTPSGFPGNFRKRKVLGTLWFPSGLPENPRKGQALYAVALCHLWLRPGRINPACDGCVPAPVSYPDRYGFSALRDAERVHCGISALGRAQLDVRIYLSICVSCKS